MREIEKEAGLVEVATIVSDALRTAGIAATLSGGGAVSIYTNNEYQSKDLDFVTAAMLADLAPILNDLGFVHTGGSRLSQFEHPLVELMHPLIFSLYDTKDSSIDSLLHQHLPESLHQRT